MLIINPKANQIKHMLQQFPIFQQNSNTDIYLFTIGFPDTIEALKSDELATFMPIVLSVDK